MCVDQRNVSVCLSTNNTRSNRHHAPTDHGTCRLPIARKHDVCVSGFSTYERRMVIVIPEAAWKSSGVHFFFVAFAHLDHALTGFPAGTHFGALRRNQLNWLVDRSAHRAFCPFHLGGFCRFVSKRLLFCHTTPDYSIACASLSIIGCTQVVQRVSNQCTRTRFPPCSWAFSSTKFADFVNSLVSMPSERPQSPMLIVTENVRVPAVITSLVTTLRTFSAQR